MAADPAPLTGRCMCDAVEFEISAPMPGAVYCHCKRCQQRTGTAFSATGITQPGTFAITRGEDVVREWDPPLGQWVADASQGNA